MGMPYAVGASIALGSAPAGRRFRISIWRAAALGLLGLVAVWPSQQALAQEPCPEPKRQDPGTSALCPPTEVPDGTITATPEVCTIPSGGTVCSSSIHWTTVNASNVKVNAFSHATQTTALFATGTLGTQSAPWITAAGYRFDPIGSGQTLASVEVKGNFAPSVSLTSPANGATFTAPASIALAASASDPDGTISQVEFFNGATLLATDTTSPYSWTWSNVAAGTYSLTAKATDNAGAVTTSSPVSVTVNALPTVSLTSPAAGAVVNAPGSFTLTAGASDPDGTISKVEFFNGATLLATDTTSPYSFTWSNVPAGSYTLTAKATDNRNAVTTSSPISVTVNALPTVSLTSPVNGASFTAPASIALTASASDSDGSISKVEFYNGTTLLATDTTSPYSFTWSNVAAGSYTLTAKATDNLGAVTTSTAVTVTVNPPANQAPTVSLTSPANGATFTAPASIALTASASDPDGTVSKVEFFNGATLLATDTTSPYSFTWSNVPAGSYTLTARATDNLGATKTSTAVTVTVNPPVNQAPTVSLTSPANGAVFTAPASIALAASASDSDGTISKVEFFNGATLLATDTSSPYSFSWSNVAAGSYTLTARATDNLGATKTSTAVSITVNAAAVPCFTLPPRPAGAP